MRCWPKFIDPQDLVPVSEKNLVLHCWDLQSIRRNPWKQTWWIHPLEIFTVLWAVFMCYFWPLVCSSGSFLVYLVMLLYTGCVFVHVCVFHGYFLWLCLCSRDDSWLSVLFQREKIHTINLSLSNTLCHTHRYAHTQTHIYTHRHKRCYVTVFQRPHKQTKMSASSFMLFGITDTNEPKISFTCTHFAFPLTSSSRSWL